MRISEWRQQLIEEIERISDETQQRLAWFETDATKNPNPDHPDELFCRLFDGLSVELFITEGANAVGSEELAALKRLVQALNNYATAMPRSLDPHEVIDDPRWRDIRSLASKVVEASKNKL